MFFGSNYRGIVHASLKSKLPSASFPENYSWQLSIKPHSFELCFRPSGLALDSFCASFSKMRSKVLASLLYVIEPCKRFHGILCFYQQGALGRLIGSFRLFISSTNPCPANNVNFPLKNLKCECMQLVGLVTGGNFH